MERNVNIRRKAAMLAVLVPHSPQYYLWQLQKGDAFFMFKSQILGGKLDTRRVVLLAILVALQLVLARFAIPLVIFRISFGFIVTALMGWWFGPLWAGIAAVIGDLINSLMIGVPGGYFPGFTLSAFLGAFIYGCYFYRQKITWLRVILAVLTVVLFVNLFLNSWWVAILSHTPITYHLGARAIGEIVTLIVHPIVLYAVMHFDPIVRLKNRL